MRARYLPLALAVLSCAEPSAPAPQAFLGGLPLPPPPVGLLTCTPLASDSITQTIGPEGGTLLVGTNVLSVPAGALDSAVSITAVAPSDTVNRVQFQPSPADPRIPVLGGRRVRSDRHWADPALLGLCHRLVRGTPSA